MLLSASLYLERVLVTNEYFRILCGHRTCTIGGQLWSSRILCPYLVQNGLLFGSQALLSEQQGVWARVLHFKELFIRLANVLLIQR